MQHLGDSARRERFRVSVRFDDGGTTVWFDSREVLTDPTDRPDWVHTRSAPRAIHRVPPRLSSAMIDAGLPDGECRVSVEINVHGRPRDPEVLACPEGYGDVARRAVGRWRFEPAIEDGRPVAHRMVVAIRFSP